jgi:hypothetical protein
VALSQARILYQNHSGDYPQVILTIPVTCRTPVLPLASNLHLHLQPVTHLPPITPPFRLLLHPPSQLLRPSASYPPSRLLFPPPANNSPIPPVTTPYRLLIHPSTCCSALLPITAPSLVNTPPSVLFLHPLSVTHPPVTPPSLLLLHPSYYPTCYSLLSLLLTLPPSCNSTIPPFAPSSLWYSLSHLAVTPSFLCYSPSDLLLTLPPVTPSSLWYSPSCLLLPPLSVTHPPACYSLLSSVTHPPACYSLLSLLLTVTPSFLCFSPSCLLLPPLSDTHSRSCYSLLSLLLTLPPVTSPSCLLLHPLTF